MRSRMLLIVPAVVLLHTGCSDLVLEPSPPETPGPNASAAVGSELEAARFEAEFARATARAAATVRPGESIQEAVDRAAPGAVIHIEPGVYYQSVTINKPGIKLVGKKGGEGVVLINPGGAQHGVRVGTNGGGVAIANLTTRGYDVNGVFMTGVQGFTVMRVTAEDNGEYGIYPVRSSDGVMLHNTASGHADAGLYIGQSQRVRMLHNTVHGNVIGIEISNSLDIGARHNHAHNNTIGILAVLLPPSPRRTMLVAADILIAHNRVEDNNLPNFADETELPAHIPSGSGILVVGTDRTVVEHNTVRRNDWVGIGVGSVATFAQLAGLPLEAIAALEPHPDQVVVRKNTAVQNGWNPPAGFPLPGADLLWDGTGTGNCWEKNVFHTSVPPVLPPCR
jgi:parallel beta-helix repeat protein